MRTWMRWTARLRGPRPPDGTEDRTMPVLGVEEIEVAALGLPRSERARLIRKLLETTEDLTDEEVAPAGVEEITPADVEEIAHFGAEEPQRPEAVGGIHQAGDNRPVDDLLREARAKLKGFTRPRRPEPPA